MYPYLITYLLASHTRPQMRNYKFLVSSLPLALSALLAQAVVFYLIALAVTQMQMMLILPFGLVSQQSGNSAGSGPLPLILLLTGLALAIASLFCVISSFRRHESRWGWRLLPITLLAVYAASWFPLLHG